uniref:Uncharacterized protein n=1 Tax=Anguilla anguilla TaxID=7936 RepID=A0A0E9PFJ3_ANGAN
MKYITYKWGLHVSNLHVSFCDELENIYLTALVS